MDKDLEWIENMASMEFHPCDTPRGMMYYNMDILTKDQQRKLNKLKTETVRENHRYLANHPEIRACVFLISKLVLKQRPRANVHETIAEYFSKSRVDIEADVNEYLKSHQPIAYEARSHLDMFGNRSAFSSCESESTSGTVYSTTSSRSTTPSQKESSTWPADFPDIDLETLQMDMSVSLRNLGIEYQKLRNMGSETPIHSISVVTQTTIDEEGSPSKSDHVTINEYLKRLETMSYADMMEGEMEGEGPYTGHIPRLEDYDAGYGRRRKTFEAGQGLIDEIDKPIADYMAELQDAGEEEDKYEGTDFPLATPVPDIKSLSHLHAERILKTSLDPIAKTTGKQSKVHMDPSESEMKALMARRSVRISAVADADLKRFETHMEEQKKRGRKSRDDRKSQDETERRVRTDARLSQDERSAKAKMRNGKFADESNKLHPDTAGIREEGKEDWEGEEDSFRRSLDQKSKGSFGKPRQISSVSQETESRRQSVRTSRSDSGGDDQMEAIESTIRHQFDTSFKSFSHMKDEEPKSKSNIYFRAESNIEENAAFEGFDKNIGVSHTDSAHTRARLEQKVSFGVKKSVSAEEKTE